MTQFYSRVDTMLNGDVYSIPFSYIKEEEIQVYIGDELYTDWYFLNDSQIKINNLPSDLPSNTIVSVRRLTDISKKEVEYTNNTLLNKENLNLSQDQLLHAVQEIYDNNIQFEIDTLKVIQENKEEILDTVQENKEEVLENQQDFEDEVNHKIQEVSEAASKINALEEAVDTAIAAANTATEQASIATDTTQEIITASEELKDAIDKTVEEINDKITNFDTSLEEKTVELTQEADRQINNIQSTGFYMRDDKLYFINSEGEEEEFKSGGLLTGQTIFSLDPLIEDTLHLMDGALLSVGGMYDQFIKGYIANLFTKYPQRFCSEEEWQNSVATYGVCGKYVYTEGVSVRLPKVTGIVEGILDANALGEVVEAGLPNITGEFEPYVGGGNNGSGWDSASYKLAGAFYRTTTHSVKTSTNTSNAYSASGVGIDASRSSSVYGKSSTVQPQTIKGYYYIVVATGSKTDVEINLDNIATDLNGKADTDLTNVTNQAKELASLWAFPSKKYIDLELGASGSSYTFPANGYLYLNKGAFGRYQYVNIFINGDGDNNNERQYCKAIHETDTAFGTVLTFVVPVKKDDIVTIKYTATGGTNYFKFFYAIGSESEAE